MLWLLWSDTGLAIPRSNPRLEIGVQNLLIWSMACCGLEILALHWSLIGGLMDWLSRSDWWTRYGCD